MARYAARSFDFLLKCSSKVTRPSLPTASLISSGINSTSRCYCSTLTGVSRFSALSPWQSASYRHCVRTFNTEADKELSAFLEGELKYENERKGQRGPAPDMKGFNIEPKGAEVSMTREQNGERVTISFNVNNSVDADDSSDAEQAEQPLEMICKPAFTVEISKRDNSRLVLECQFVHSDDSQRIEGSDNKEVFEVVEAWIQDGELSESTYIISADNMDGTLYDVLINSMCDRGLDDDFISHLADYATRYEHDQYITFLEKLQHFSKS